MSGDQDQDPSVPAPADAQRPALRVVRGDATPEEVAALVAVLTAVSAGAPEPAPRHTSRWSSPERALRRPLSPGPGAWRASSWPR